ncbi:DEAD/DEAH box helicase [Phycicoccus sp. Soil803]|uniref:DEAD/DEAH box helicase n=1 Tax=Phycicoccus sp. Soil803 TaxID=1736415 RepID=UPI000A624908|nr:DEAD/DEAH box helicase [Phycicoccus sp. Soil803]
MSSHAISLNRAPASVSFVDLGIHPRVIAALKERGIDLPFPIQAATLPDSLAGRDVLGRGRTGSGKTVAFALPMVSALAKSGRRRAPHTPRALVLVPTRELAIQVAETVTPLAAALELRTMTIFGGVGQNPQVAALRRGIDIVIATPGRLEDLIGQGHVRLGDIEVTVLDEADHMADLGFLPAVKRLLDATPRDGQRLLFSATLDNAIDQLVKRYLHNPVTHSVDSAASPVPAMTHHLFNVSRDNKPAVVRELVAGQGRTLAFTRTKHAAKKLAKQLTASGIPAVDLHGNLSQAARQRNLAAFSEGHSRVLVATDIAARGIHVDDVTLVVHVDPPAEHKAYLHRSGRTARAGAEGVVVTVSTPEERGDTRTLMRQAGIKPTAVDVAPGHPAIGDLTGPVAELVTPAPVVAQPSNGNANGGRSQRGRGGSGQPRQQGGAGRSSGGAGRASGGGARGRRGGSQSSSTESYRTETPRSGGSQGARSQSSRGGSRQGASQGQARSGGIAAFSAGRRGR